MNDAIRKFINTDINYEDPCNYGGGEHVKYIKNYSYELLASCNRLAVNILNGICGQNKWGINTDTNEFDFIPLSPYPWTSRQHAAIVRAQYDRPIIGVRRMLDLCTISSIKKNRDHLIEYFLKCYDWIDLPVALYIYGTLIEPDRSEGLQIAISADKKTKQPIICFSEKVTLDDIQWYLSQNWSFIKSGHKIYKKAKASQITFFIVRNVIVNYLAIRKAGKMSANELLGILEYCFKIDKMPFLTDVYTDLEVWKDVSRFRKQSKSDWFYDALLKFNREMNTDVLEVLYSSESLNGVVSFMEEHQRNPDYFSLLYKIPTVFSNNQKLQMFELSFKEQTFDIARV